MEKREIGSGRWVRREIGFKTLTEERFTKGLGIESDVAPKGIDISREEEEEEEEETLQISGKTEKIGGGVDVHGKSR